MIKSNTVKQDEHVVFFPTLAHYDGASESWRADIHGWIFEPELAGELRQLFRKATGVPKKDEQNPDIFKQRSSDFLVDNERGKRITIAVGDHHYVIPQRSAPNGHFSGRISIPEGIVNQNAKDGVLSFKTVLKQGDQRRFSGHITLVPAEGTSIVSDIDDTIKISHVEDKMELMKNTFFRPFEPAPGMADYYQLLSHLPDASFHYVSASPWQLYRVLEDFRENQDFPSGSFHMKLFRWKDRSVANLFASPIEYKMNIIELLMQRFPKRHFILIGDSGEKDPEVYGILAEKYPKQVKKIYIRNVTGEKRDNERMQNALKHVGKKNWVLFEHPDEIP